MVDDIVTYNAAEQKFTRKKHVSYTNVQWLLKQPIIWLPPLTHWGQKTDTFVSKLNIIGPDIGLSPAPRQAIIWISATILLIQTLGTNFSEVLSEMHTFSLKILYLKMSFTKWRQFCLNVLRVSLLQPI